MLNKYGTLILCVLMSTCSSTMFNKTKTLRQFLLSGYDVNIRPGLDISGPLVANVTFYLTSLTHLREIEGEMGTVGYVKVVWHEERMRWNPGRYGGVASLILSPTEIWRPILTIGNPTFRISTMNAGSVPVIVLYNGTAIWNPGEVFRTSCSFNLYKYPFDRQTCHISLLPWSYPISEISLFTPETQVFTPFYDENGEWELSDSFVYVEAEYSMSIAYFNVVFTRRPEFVIVNVLLPITLLAYLNCLVFLISPESDEKISFAVTVLLSFAVFMTLVGDTIPKTSRPMPLLCYYLISVFSGSALIVVSAIINTNLIHHDDSEPVHLLGQIIVRKTRSLGCCCRKPTVAPAHELPCFTKVEPIIGEDGKPVGGAESDTHAPDDVIKEPVDDVTWRDVGRCLDKLSMLGFFLYFTLIAGLHLLKIVY